MRGYFDFCAAAEVILRSFLVGTTTFSKSGAVPENVKLLDAVSGGLFQLS